MNDIQTTGRSEQSPSLTLWFSMGKTRQFLISDAETLPQGDLIIQTRIGRKLAVDSESVNPFEVSDEEANAWLKEQLQNVTRQLSENLRAAFSRSPRRAEEKGECVKSQAQSDQEKKASATPGLDLLADITGTPRKSMNGNYGAISHALRDYLSDIASTVSDSISGEPQREASAHERMEGWKQTLRKHGIKVADKEKQGKADSDSSDQAQEPSEASEKDQKTDAAKNEDGNSKSGIGASLMAFREAEERLKTQLHKVGQAFQRLAGARKARAAADRDDESLQKKFDE